MTSRRKRSRCIREKCAVVSAAALNDQIRSVQRKAGWQPSQIAANGVRADVAIIAVAAHDEEIIAGRHGGNHRCALRGSRIGAGNHIPVGIAQLDHRVEIRSDGCHVDREDNLDAGNKRVDGASGVIRFGSWDLPELEAVQRTANRVRDMWEAGGRWPSAGGVVGIFPGS